MSSSRLVGALLLASLWGQARADGNAPLELTVGGPLRVEAGRPLQLRLDVVDRSGFWGAVRLLAHRLAPAAAVPSASTTAPVVVDVHWIDPATTAQVVRFRDGVAALSVPAGAARTAAYSLTWSDPGGRASVRLPAGGDFPVEIAAPGASAVLAGTGNADLEVFGEELPVTLEISDPAGIAGATVYHRSAPASAFATAEMRLDAGSPARGVWKAALPRPGGAEATVEYYVEIANSGGARTLYGSGAVPYRLYMPDPTR